MSQQVITQELSEIIITHCGKCQYRRIDKEIQYLIEEYPNVRVEFDNTLKIPIVIVMYRENKITMKLQNCFPFKPPEIELNSEPYINILTFNNNEQIKLLREVFGMDCLCCHSLMCQLNWCSQLKLKDILDEICKNIEIIHDINNYVSNKKDIIEDNVSSDVDDNKNNKPFDILGYKRKIY